MKEKEQQKLEKLEELLRKEGFTEETISSFNLTYNLVQKDKMRIENEREYIQKGLKNQKRGLYDNYCNINQNFTKYVGQCNLSKNAYRVLMYMLSYMEKGNLVTLTAANIKKLSGINAGNISKAIKELKERKIIYQEKMNGTEKIYKINYSINKNMAIKTGIYDKQYLENLRKKS